MSWCLSLLPFSLFQITIMNIKINFSHSSSSLPWSCWLPFLWLLTCLLKSIWVSAEKNSWLKKKILNTYNFRMLRNWKLIMKIIFNQLKKINKIKLFLLENYNFKNLLRKWFLIKKIVGIVFKKDVIYLFYFYFKDTGFAFSNEEKRNWN